MPRKTTTLAVSLAAALTLGASSLAWAHSPCGMGYHAMMGPAGCGCFGHDMAPGSAMGQGIMSGYMMANGGAPNTMGYWMAPQSISYGTATGLTQVVRDQNLSVEDVKRFMEQQLVTLQNANLKVGKIEEKDKDTIAAEVVTKDDSLVERYMVDRHTGTMQRVP